MSESFSNSSKDPSGIGQQLDEYNCVYCGDLISLTDLNEHVTNCSIPWSSTNTTKEKLVNPLNFIYDEHNPDSSQCIEVPLEEALEDVEEGDLNILGDADADYQNLLQEEPNLTETENILKRELAIESIIQGNTNSKKRKKVEVQSVVSIGSYKTKVYSKDKVVIEEETRAEKNNVQTLTVLNSARQPSATEKKSDQSKSDVNIVPIKPSKTKKTKVVQIKPGQKLFQRIPSPVEEVAEKPAGIFDFVDEQDDEDSKRKRKELRELKDRTCCTCSKVFSDPVAVLYHKRKEHYRSKIIVDKLELQSYLLKPPKSHCPVCLKQLHHKKNVKTLYVKHLMTHANVLESSLKCKVCERKFKRKDHLENHERRHF
ncbi:unnamed protein product [Ceutorhynchus assimilis]|uniref:C2H2-type domain-containing protein n=1 Tax=Ceutorhynchus assimilis TaxID=467358 RepID=A0A9N9MW69_9CUCU|nr:unnamed protein product [Ceutorhynchus assimilis]